MPYRIDKHASPLRAAHRRADGTVLVEGFAARAGVYEYRHADGSVTRELIDEDELFSADSLATLARASLTLKHPPEFVTPDNVQLHQVGDVGEEVRCEGGFVRITGAVRRRDAIAAIEGGTKQLSCGYVCEIDPTPGVWRGQHYDCRQVRRRYNHLAIVPAGRHGEDVRLRVDGDDLAVQVSRPDAADPPPVQRDPQNTPSGTPPTPATIMRITIDGIEYEVTDATLATLIQRLAKERNDSREAVTQAAARFDEASKAVKELDQVKGELTATKAELEKAKADRVDEAEINRRVDARADLLDVAKRAGVPAVEGDKPRTDADLCKAIVAKRYPSVKLDGLSDEAVQGMFLVAKGELQATQTPTRPAAAAFGGPPTPQPYADAAEERLAKAQAAYLDAQTGKSATATP